MSVRILLLAFTLFLTACGRDDGAEVIAEPVIPDDSLIEPPARAALPVLTEAAVAKRAKLLETAETDRLRPLARIADAEPGFVSNIGEQAHFTYWNLLRRIGVDPNTKLIELFAEPHAAKQVGEETWYIWPDLAALSAEELIPERLDFQDRARLMELVGEDGIARIREGSPYPGMRTAIAEDGRWVYFIYNEDLIEASSEGSE
ncbi:MAG: hypothetical protein V3V03_07140 [Hyphomonadaceae bacterium]